MRTEKNLRSISIERFVWKWRVHIEHHIDTSNVEDRRALIVVEGWVDIVHSDGIDTEPLHESRISQADLAVGERILSRLWLVSRRSAWLIGNTDDLEALAGLLNNEIRALDGEGLDGRGDLGELSAECEERDGGLGIKH